MKSPLSVSRPATAETIRRRAEQGLHPTNLPLGYVCPKGMVAVPDPNVAPLVQEAILLMGTGEWSVRRLHAHMTEKGLRSKCGRRLALSSFHKMLTNPFYAGFVVFSSKVMVPGRHKRIVNFKELQAAKQNLRNNRR